MKKLLIASILTCFSVQVMGNTLPSNNTQPKMRFGVFEVTDSNIKQIEGNKYSISNPSHWLCWAAFDMPFTASNTIIENFYSPSRTTFVDAVQQVSTSPDGKTHTITSQVPAQQNLFVERCWTFDKSDPLGKYSADIRVNDIIFPTQHFEVTK